MSTAPPQRKPTNLSLDRSLLPEARELKINLSRATEAGVRQEIARAKAELWKADNATALESYNRWVEANGMPLDRYRLFLAQISDTARCGASKYSADCISVYRDAVRWNSKPPSPAG